MAVAQNADVVFAVRLIYNYRELVRSGVLDGVCQRLADGRVQKQQCLSLPGLPALKLHPAADEIGDLNKLVLRRPRLGHDGRVFHVRNDVLPGREQLSLAHLGAVVRECVFRHDEQPPEIIVYAHFRAQKLFIHVVLDDVFQQLPLPVMQLGHADVVLPQAVAVVVEFRDVRGFKLRYLRPVNDEIFPLELPDCPVPEPAKEDILRRLLRLSRQRSALKILPHRVGVRDRVPRELIANGVYRLVCQNWPSVGRGEADPVGVRIDSASDRAGHAITLSQPAKHISHFPSVRMIS